MFPSELRKFMVKFGCVPILASQVECAPQHAPFSVFSRLPRTAGEYYRNQFDHQHVEPGDFAPDERFSGSLAITASNSAGGVFPLAAS
jgi:hypothetical protein